MDNLVIGVQLADDSTRCSSHLQGKGEARCENVPTKFPLQDTIASVEEVTRRLPKDDADDLRGRVWNPEECPAAQGQPEEGAPESFEGAQKSGG